MKKKKVVSKKSKDNFIFHGKEIVVLPSGWVVVGDSYQNGTNFDLKNAQVIHYWGTTEGLGEIATNGPTPKTKLFAIKYGIKFHELTYIMRLPCSEKWFQI